MADKQEGGDYMSDGKTDSEIDMSIMKDSLKFKKFEELSPLRKWVGIALLIVISGTFVYAAMNWEDFYYSYGNITYPDGCVEEYNRGELLSLECTNGRDMLERKNPGYYSDIVLPPLVEE